MDTFQKDLKTAFKGKLIGTPFMQKQVCLTLSRLPSEYIEYLSAHCWFLSSSPDAWAYTFNGNDIQNKHFIFLSDELLQEPIRQIQFTILHEIGHVILRHRNSINYRQTKEEISFQEKGADEFANKYLNI